MACVNENAPETAHVGWVTEIQYIVWAMAGVRSIYNTKVAMSTMTRRGKKEGVHKGEGTTLRRWMEEDRMGGREKQGTEGARGQAR